MVFEENQYFLGGQMIQTTDFAGTQTETSWLYLWRMPESGFSQKIFFRALQGLKVGSSAKNGILGGSFGAFRRYFCIVVDWYEHEMGENDRNSIDIMIIKRLLGFNSAF